MYYMMIIKGKEKIFVLFLKFLLLLEELIEILKFKFKNLLRYFIFRYLVFFSEEILFFEYIFI